MRLTHRADGSEADAGIPFKELRVTVEGDLDLRGTLGISRHAPSASLPSVFASTSMPLRQPSTNGVAFSGQLRRTAS